MEGKLARYRLHLGTAAVHIEPGHHLCIVPDRSLASRQPIYLPFAEGSDPTHAVPSVTSCSMLLFFPAYTRSRFRTSSSFQRSLG